MSKRRKTLVVASILLMALTCLLALRPGGRASTTASATETDEASPSGSPTHVAVAPRPAPQAADPPTVTAEPSARAFGELPALGTNAQAKVWVKATYGDGEDQLAFLDDGEDYPPQGFVPTRDGKLVVLDSWKQRLVRYDASGKIEGTIALPKEAVVLPAGVAITEDGTIAVMDSPGVQTKGTVLLDASGKKKGELPQIGATFLDMYAAGNAVYAVHMGRSSVKAGNTDGTPSDERPGVYRNEEDGMVPGIVGSDGNTVVSVSPYQHPEGFIVNVMRGAEPKLVFAGTYKYPHKGAPEDDAAIVYLRSDDRGNVYIVLWVDQAMSLVCLDGNTGAPTGRVGIPGRPDEGGTQFTTFNVVPTGGIVFQRATNEGSSYEFYNCTPS